MSTDQKKCIICDEHLLEGQKTRKINAENIENYRKASLTRQDNKHLLLLDHESFEFHETCAKSYTSNIHIQAFLKKQCKNEVPSTSRSSRCSGNFDFKNLCFVCESDASESFIQKQKKNRAEHRKIVKKITSNDKRYFFINNLKNKEDTFSVSIFSRITSVNDLVEVEARYHDICRKKLENFITNKTKEKVPTLVETATEFICKYISANADKSQFSITRILSDFTETEWPDLRYIKNKLLEIYGDEVKIISTKDGPVITFNRISNEVLANHWYTKKFQNEQQERLSIVQKATKIIFEDIKLKSYNTNTYPPTNSFFDESEDDIPESLKILLSGLILKNKSNTDSYKTKLLAIAHAIIANVRPRSFLSCVQIGLAAALAKQYGSKELLDILSSLGFCCSYSEAQLFESSVVRHHENLRFDSRAFNQYVFDNADHNVNTLDGKNTLHVMGGIEVVTPYDSVSSDTPINRERCSAIQAGEFGKVPIKYFKKPPESGYKNVIIKDFSQLKEICLDVKISNLELLWFMGKQKLGADFPGWNGYMEKIMEHNSFVRSRVLLLRFIDKPASDLNTIYTSLLMADDERKKTNQKHCAVTFDQPLYHKAREIVECTPELCNIIVRLGGFHLLMSFMGSIGYIMDGSGLKELFCEIYAENSVEKMLNGHAYARAVRGHILAHLSLAQLLLSSFELSETEIQLISELLDLKNSNTLEDIKNIKFTNIRERFLKHIQKLKENGPTSQLWLQYFEMVTLMKQFIEAERSGNWNLHLDTVRRMLPYFYASGHHLYAKSATIYLQDMLELEKKMDIQEFNTFTKKGYFTIRRTEKFWSGIWSDMAIEQILMRTMKTRGGLTRGRGVSDSVISKWILTMPALTDLLNALQNFCGLNFSSSEQHVDTRVARLARDTQDLNKFIDFFVKYNPFFISDELLSITSGLQADKTINCHQALERGELLLKNTIDKNLIDIKFQRSRRVLPLQKMNSVKIQEREVTINPTLIFQRISVAVDEEENLSKYLSYELAPYPVSIFDNGSMRKTDKSTLYNSFDPIDDLTLINDCRHVIDGGYLLHKVVWSQKQSYDYILEQYVEYIKKNYSADSVIVFDGYPDSGKSTKSAERNRRKTKQFCTELNVDLHVTPNVKQEKFFSNEKNKKKFIEKLRQRLKDRGFYTKQAYEDADTLLVETAISICSRIRSTVVIAEDIDVLVIFTQRVTEDQNIYFLKPSRQNQSEKLYNCSSLRSLELKNIICFIHAFCGCDTTSAFYKHGKNKIFKILLDNPDLKREAENFNSPLSEYSLIDTAGEKIISSLYFGKKNKKKNLNELRYLGFKACSVKKAFHLSTLPPTRSAAAQHSRRVFCQVQKWLGKEIDESQWGWREENNELRPTYTTDDLIPIDLMRDISCKCKKGCTKSCGCVKYGLRCSAFCGNCHGETCENNIIQISTREIELDEQSECENIDELSVDFSDVVDFQDNCEIYESELGIQSDDDDEIPRKRIRI